MQRPPAQETPLSDAAVVPAGAGVTCTVQFVPSNRSASGSCGGAFSPKPGAIAQPTASHEACAPAGMHATPFSWSPDAFGSLALGWSVQWVPSQPSAIAKADGPAIWYPTASHAPSNEQVTPNSPAGALSAAAGRRLQETPFQLSDSPTSAVPV